LEGRHQNNDLSYEGLGLHSISKGKESNEEALPQSYQGPSVTGQKDR